MTAPNLTITAQPSEGAALVYGALAARTSNDPPAGQFSLVLMITNKELTPVHLNQVAISFVGPPAVSPSSIPADVTIGALQTAQWQFETINNIILPVPAPGAVHIALSCDGFTDAAVLDLPLVPYASPIPGGGYDFPASVTDLKRGEFWTGLSAAHASGYGTQLFAYDLWIRRFDPVAKSWPTSVPGSDNTLNKNYYIWGKPVLAMADGVVVEFHDGMAANTPPLLPVPTPDPIEGNHFYIQHGSDLALYAHLQAGSLNSSLTSGPHANGTGAAVTKGQLLALAGNSGNSSEPHLHIHVLRATVPWGGPLRPVPFNGINVLDLSLVPPLATPNTDSPWSFVISQDLPSVLSAIWPAPLRLGRNSLFRRFELLAWAWIIIIGALMFTPGGVECIACGPLLTNVLGVVSIVLGGVGLIRSVMAERASTRRQIAPLPIDAKQFDALSKREDR
jgi:hypothetical protein